jgi:hypothetical protein
MNSVVPCLLGHWIENEQPRLSTVDVPVATPVHIHPAVDSLSDVQKRRQGTALFIRALPNVDVSKPG